jgi:ABC-2 type transport system ATP-binding protein
MTGPIFELSRVTRSNGASPALDDLSLSMSQGEVLGVVGPNGAGKSTLMRTLLGLIPVQSGDVRVFGVDPWLQPVVARRRIGYASDGRGDDSRATIRELMHLHGAVYPRWDAECAKRLIGTLAAKSDSRVDRLSKGEAQRVRVALAMAHRPDLLLLDEPGAGLDPSLRREFLEDAVSLLSESDVSIVINSHHLSDIQRIASRIVLMNAGRIVLDVELDSLQERYCLVSVGERQLRNAGSAAPGDIPDYVGHRCRNGEAKIVMQCDAQTAAARMAEHALDAHVSHPNLEELYVVLVGGSHEHN